MVGRNCELRRLPREASLATPTSRCHRRSSQFPPFDPFPPRREERPVSEELRVELTAYSFHFELRRGTPDLQLLTTRSEVDDPAQHLPDPIRCFLHLVGDRREV